MVWWKSLRDNWLKFYRLSWRERRLIGQAVFLLPAMALALRVLGLRRAQSTLLRLLPGDKMRIESQGEYIDRLVTSTARAVRIAAVHGFYPANCLQQSLALWWLLRRQAVASHLRIGVRKQRGQLQAHSWVECSGHPVNENEDVHRCFLPFNRVLGMAEVESQ